MQQENVFFEKDKRLIPYLLSLPDFDFLGTEEISGIVYFKFSPLSAVQKAINAFYNRTAPMVHAIDLLEGVERFRNELYKSKNPYAR